MFLTIVLCVIVACTPQEVNKFDYLRITIDGQQTLGISRKDMLVRAVVVFFHGMDGNEFSVTSDSVHTDLTTTLVQAGFAVISSNAGGNAWGNLSSQKNYLYAGGAAAAHYSTENIFFVAESMGAIAAANLLAQGFSPRVKGFAAINPVFDMASASPQYKQGIDSMYPNQSYGGVNPISLPTGAFKGINMRFYVNPDDAVVKPDTNALAFQNRFGSEADLSVVKCSGGPNDPSCFQGNDIVKWFSALEKGRP
jgi:pimeloyl-ACP methyl ester carboxylesterase